MLINICDNELRKNVLQIQFAEIKEVYCKDFEYL